MFTPFDNEKTSCSIDGLTIENRLDRITIYGNIDITRDQQGLVNALQLKALLDRAILTMQQDHHLPAQIVFSQSTMVKNPFK